MAPNLENTSKVLTLGENDTVEISSRTDSETARLAVKLDGKTLLEQDVDTELRSPLPPLSSGQHVLHWTVYRPTLSLTVRCEVLVNGESRVRQVSDSPEDGFLTTTDLFLQVE
jgi:hypothetical protein